MTTNNFYGLNIAPKILETIERLKFTVPTPIQFKTIPTAIEGKDIIGIAQTGTGKTLAFAIPMVQRLSQTNGRGLVLVPTRELAIQVNETFLKIGSVFGMRSAVIIGGAPMFAQIQELKRKPRVIIATPGRLMDHMERRTVNLSDVSVLVLDEADRMLDMGFLPQIRQILRQVPKEKQTMLFSATIPSEIVGVANAYMKLPIHVEVAPTGTMADGIEQELYIVRKEAKLKLLGKVLEKYHGSVLLFSRTKSGARRIVKAVKDMRHSAAEIHSDRSLGQRREALEGFKSGRYRVLVATDIAARGIDVIGIELVINFDLPEDPENYVHRIGRTGRAGKEGRAIAFATPDQGSDVKNIERLIRNTLPVSDHPDLPKETFIRAPAPRIGFIGRGGGRRGGAHFRRRPGLR